MRSFERRDFLRQAALLPALVSLGLLTGREALAAAEAIAFDATSVQEALSALGGISASGTQISLTVPDIAENGAMVPIIIASTLKSVEEIFVVVESNPNPLVVRFTVPESTQPYISTRIKMAESGNVFAVVRAEGKLYSVHKQTVVTVGGCG